MPHVPTRQRAEERVRQKMFVRLYHPSGDSFDLAQTIDVSRHGARVSTKRAWTPNEHLLLRSLRGNLTAYARVVHCAATSEDSYCLGLQLYNPMGGWGSSPQSHPHPRSA